MPSVVDGVQYFKKKILVCVTDMQLDCKRQTGRGRAWASLLPHQANSDRTPRPRLVQDWQDPPAKHWHSICWHRQLCDVAAVCIECLSCLLALADWKWYTHIQSSEP